MSTASRTSQRVLMVVLVALLVAIGVILLGRSGGGGSSTSSAPAVNSSGFAGPTMPPGLHAAPFSLVDQNGHRVTLSSYLGHVVVVTFIHSKCQDACPFMVEQIKGALNSLPGSGRGIETIGISVDPAQDTPTNRRTFLAQHAMTGRMAFVNGPTPTLAKVWKSYAIQPVKRDNINHSAFVLLIDKQGLERVGFAADQLTPDGLAHDIRKLEAQRS